MRYRVKMWLSGNKIKCCSQTCSGCPRIDTCKEMTLLMTPTSRVSYLRGVKKRTAIGTHLSCQALLSILALITTAEKAKAVLVFMVVSNICVLILLKFGRVFLRGIRSQLRCIRRKLRVKELERKSKKP